MSRVNLLPPEVRKARRDADLIRRIRFFALCGVLLLGGLYTIRTVELFLVNRDLDSVREDQALVQVRLAELAEVRTQRDAIIAGEALTAQLLIGEVSWSDQFLRIASAVPPGVVLTTLDGQVAGDQGVGVIGSVSFTAASDQLIPAEAWLRRLAIEEGWANGWVSSAILAENEIFTVSGSIDLTTDAISARGRGPA